MEQKKQLQTDKLTKSTNSHSKQSDAVRVTWSKQQIQTIRRMSCYLSVDNHFPVALSKSIFLVVDPPGEIASMDLLFKWVPHRITIVPALTNWTCPPNVTR